MSRAPQYIGDGVYVAFDGYHVWLLTGSHREEEATNKIALEPHVVAALVKYLGDTYKADPA